MSASRGPAHRPRGAPAPRVGRGEVVGVPRRGIAGRFAADARAPREGGLLRLEHHHARALGQHEAVATAVERRQAPVFDSASAPNAAVASGVIAASLPPARPRRRRRADQPLGDADRRPPRTRRRCQTTARAGSAPSRSRPRPRWPSAAGSTAARCGRRPRRRRMMWFASSVPMPPIPVPITRCGAVGVVWRVAVPAGVLDRLGGSRQRELGEAVRRGAPPWWRGAPWARTRSRGRSRPRSRTGPRSSARAACGRPRRAA